ncbi:MAG: hypothetical protein FWE80_07155, partial [Oscillospiraceae bacterium]|nr:hypothetical protein [Oscillospiraceae bacterium]
GINRERRKRSFFRPAASKMLVINKLFLRFFPCGTEKSSFIRSRLIPEEVYYYKAKEKWDKEKEPDKQINCE